MSEHDPPLGTLVLVQQREGRRGDLSRPGSEASCETSNEARLSRAEVADQVEDVRIGELARRPALRIARSLPRSASSPSRRQLFSRGWNRVRELRRQETRLSQLSSQALAGSAVEIRRGHGRRLRGHAGREEGSQRAGQDVAGARRGHQRSPRRIHGDAPARRRDQCARTLQQHDGPASFGETRRGAEAIRLNLAARRAEKPPRLARMGSEDERGRPSSRIALDLPRTR